MTCSATTLSGAAAAAGAEAADAFEGGGPESGKVHLSFGDTPVEEYAMQMLADHLVHGWDLAAATGMDRIMDPELVSVVQAWFAPQEEVWRAAAPSARASRSTATTHSPSCCRSTAATRTGKPEVQRLRVRPRLMARPGAPNM